MVELVDTFMNRVSASVPATNPIANLPVIEAVDINSSSEDISLAPGMDKRIELRSRLEGIGFDVGQRLVER